MGKVITEVEKPYEKIEVSYFNIDIDACTWSQSSVMEFLIDDNPFSRGEFREVYRAKCKNGKEYFLKKFQTSSFETIEQLNEI